MLPIILHKYLGQNHILLRVNVLKNGPGYCISHFTNEMTTDWSITALGQVYDHQQAEGIFWLDLHWREQYWGGCSSNVELENLLQGEYLIWLLLLLLNTNKISE